MDTITKRAVARGSTAPGTSSAAPPPRDSDSRKVHTDPISLYLRKNKHASQLFGVAAGILVFLIMLMVRFVYLDSQTDSSTLIRRHLEGSNTQGSSSSSIPKPQLKGYHEAVAQVHRLKLWPLPEPEWKKPALYPYIASRKEGTSLLGSRKRSQRYQGANLPQLGSKVVNQNVDTCIKIYKEVKSKLENDTNALTLPESCLYLIKNHTAPPGPPPAPKVIGKVSLISI